MLSPVSTRHRAPSPTLSAAPVIDCYRLSAEIITHYYSLFYFYSAPLVVARYPVTIFGFRFPLPAVVFQTSGLGSRVARHNPL